MEQTETNTGAGDEGGARESEILTDAQVQTLLGVSYWTLKALREDPDHPLPFLPVGRQIRYERDVLLDYFRRKRQRDLAAASVKTHS